MAYNQGYPSHQGDHHHIHSPPPPSYHPIEHDPHVVHPVHHPVHPAYPAHPHPVHPVQPVYPPHNSHPHPHNSDKPHVHAAIPVAAPYPGEHHTHPQAGFVTVQPLPVMQMTPQGGNRNAKNLPMGPEGREWSNGLCDCCENVGTCLLAWFCPCIMYAQNKHRREHLQQTGVPDPFHGGSAISGDCCLHATLTSTVGFGWILQIPSRSSTRMRYGIEGGACSDCCAVFWCNPCSLIQENQEIGLEESTITVLHV